MKNILFSIVIIVLFSCKSKDEPTSTFKIDPLATVSIKPVAGTKLKVKSESSTVEHLTALEIVKQTDALRLTLSSNVAGMRGFDILQRDTVSPTPMLKMWGTDILYYTQNIDGSFTGNLVLATDFIESKNCILITIKGDTIAYIPNAVLRDAESKIKTLFNSKDYEPIYTIFNNAYTFIPISGSEYKYLKDNNLQ